MSDEETEEQTGGLVVDDDQDELQEEMSLEDRKTRLQRARWNVFLYLGVAAILFFFALFPMPFSAQYDGFTSSAEKDIGLVWGLPIDGEDIFDVPVKITVVATKVPSETNVNIGVFLINAENCQSNLGDFTEEARNGDSHQHQFIMTDESIIPEGEYEFNFRIDPGHYCVIVEYFDANGMKTGASDDGLSVSGKVYPNQFFGGFAGFICLCLSSFAFIGAQRHGKAMRAVLEGANESLEKQVLASVNSGPSGPPPSSPAAGPSGPPESGPDGERTLATPSSDGEHATDAALHSDTPEVEATFVPAENGYFFRQFADGTYDQTVYFKDDSGEYQPYQP